MDVMIGLETHLQLNSRTKIFCGCPNPVTAQNEASPNTLTCPVCLGLPGAKPCFNRQVLTMALKIARVLGCTIQSPTFFSRKVYFYPDMAKNFQITQYEVPLGRGGMLAVRGKAIRIRRVHMEEDPARLVHVGGIGGQYTLVDYNRSGIPLVEIVTEPDFRSPEEARLYLQKLETILDYLGLYDASAAVFKSDANISLDGGERIEVKNVTGTREVEQALKYEMIRQANRKQRGLPVRRETRMWNADMGATQELREKEQEEDYGYIFDSDLPYLQITPARLKAVDRALPELPDQKYARFIREYGISAKTAETLVSDIDLAELFETVAADVDPKTAGTWIAGYLKKTLNWHGIRFRHAGIRSAWIVQLLRLFLDRKITDRNAELVIRKMVEEKAGPAAIIGKYRLGKTDITTEAETQIRQILEKNQHAVQDYKNGEQKALHYLIGIAMRETRGQLDANEIKQILLKLLQ